MALATFVEVTQRPETPRSSSVREDIRAIDRTHVARGRLLRSDLALRSAWRPSSCHYYSPRHVMCDPRVSWAGQSSPVRPGNALEFTLCGDAPAAGRHRRAAFILLELRVAVARRRAGVERTGGNLALEALAQIEQECREQSGVELPVIAGLSRRLSWAACGAALRSAASLTTTDLTKRIFVISADSSDHCCNALLWNEQLT